VCHPLSQVVAAAPPWHLAAIAGAVVRAFEHVSSQSAEYLSFLAKGQLPPASISLIHFKDSLIIGGYDKDVCERPYSRGRTVTT
jgi:acetyl-CoA carboxylase/biotin carboxylase 1